jgi:hypothetical protein
MDSISELEQVTEQFGRVDSCHRESLIGELDLSIEYEIDQLKRAILINKLNPEQLDVKYYEGKTVSGLKYPNKFDIFFRHNPCNLLYIIKGLSLLGYDHYAIHAGLVEVFLDDKIGVELHW